MKQRNRVVYALILGLLLATLHPLLGQAHSQAHDFDAAASVSQVPSAWPASHEVSQGSFAEISPQPIRRAVGWDNVLPVVQSSQSVSPEVAALAAGLENNPLAIFDYVHNQIEYIPSWGLLKSPRETLLAGAGNAFDQAALLAELLNAAGLQTQYIRGDIRITKAQAINWVGAADPAHVGDVFASGGIPAVDEISSLRLAHAWVQVQDGGVWHDLDPSFKTYNEQTGIDLRGAMGYTPSAFIGRAESGANVTADYVQNLNQANIPADLSTYTVNLVNYLRASRPFASVADLIGGRRIIPALSSAYPTSAPYEIITAAPTSSFASAAYTLHIELPGIDYTTSIDSIAGERITLFYECASPTDCQVLSQGGGIYNVEPAYLVNMVPKLRIGGQVVAIGSQRTLGEFEQIDISITTPGPNQRIDSFSQFLLVGEWYALPMRLQTVSLRGLVRQFALLDDAIAQGLPPDDERVLGQTLYLLGLAYYNEVDLGDQIDARLAKVVVVPHFSMMLASRNLTFYVDQQNRVVQIDPASHTIDVGLNVDSALSAENPANPSRARAWFFSAGTRGSAVEHAILEQLQPISAVSTVQILKQAAQDGQQIYYITQNNKQLIDTLGQPQPIRDRLKAVVSPTLHVVISQAPITYGQWQGSGWIELDPTSGAAAYLISGQLGSVQHGIPLLIHGGGGTAPQSPTDDSRVADRADSVRADLATGAGGVAGGSGPGGTGGSGGPPAPPNPPVYPLSSNSQDRAGERSNATALDPEELKKTIKDNIAETGPHHPERPLTNEQGEPINTISGAYVYRQADLANLGGRGIPLQFERFYTSVRHSLNSPLGYGWSHTYNLQFALGSDWARGFGSRTALEAAPVLVAAQIGLDVLDAATIPHQRFALDTIISRWMLAQITGNAVRLTEPTGAIATYVRLGNGTYMPPVGSAVLAAVSPSAGGTTLDWEDGTHLVFSPAGRLLALIDANGNRTSLIYDTQGRLIQVGDAVGRRLTLTYDGQGHLSQLTDPANRVYRYGYDMQGNLRTATDLRNGVTTYTYDTAHRLTALTDRTGATYTTNQYDDLGRVIAQADGLNRLSLLRYGGDHTVFTDPLGNQTTYVYDARGRVLAIREADGSRRSGTYDAADHMTSFTNGLGQTTVYGYDARGHWTRTSDPLARTTAWAYDAAANPVSYTDQRGKVWRFTYDSRHNLTTVTDPTGVITRYAYNVQGQLVLVQDVGTTVTLTYNPYGNLACLRNALNQATCWTYDLVGRITRWTDGTQAITQYAYDPNDNLIQVTDPSNGRTRYTYDANNNLLTAVDPNNHTTSYTYDVRFNLTRVTDPLGSSTQYAYDANDRLIRITDANNHSTTYERDKVERIVAATDPLGRKVTFGYDAAWRLTRFGRADGSAIAYIYDALGQLIRIDYPNSPDRAFSYDAAGQLSSAAYGTWSASYQYDDAGRPTSSVDVGRSVILAYIYDQVGRQIGLRVRKGTALLYNLAYGYDVAGRLNLLTYITGASPATLRLSYDAADRLTRIVDPNGASTAYGYAAGRLSQIRHLDSRAQNVALYTYTYDPAGNIISATDATPVGAFATSYSYDALDRLIREMYPRYSIVYTYDRVGNLIRRADSLGAVNYTYNGADQLLVRGSERFSYDVHGNLATWQNPRGLTTYRYDDANALTAVALAGGGAMSFSYDAFMRRIGAQTPTGPRSFLHDQYAVLLEGGATLDQAPVRYLYGADLLLARHTDQAGLATYHGDAQDNVRYLMGAGGQPLDGYRYDAFGRSGRPAGVDSNPFRFSGLSGAYQHDVAGWPALLMGYRYYDPDGARFLTRDPLPGDLPRPSSLHEYAYGLNNPLSCSDPLGLSPSDTHPIDKVPVGLTPSLTSRLLAQLGTATTGLSALFKALRGRLSAATGRLPAGRRCSSGGAGGSPGPGIDPTDPGGPGEQDQQGSQPEAGTLQAWQRVLDQGGTYALTCTPSNRLLAGPFHTNLFYSADAGHIAWNRGAPAGINDFVRAGNGSIYAGARYRGVLVSGDGGTTWAPKNAGLAANDIYTLLVGPGSAGRLFAGTEMGLFMSLNGGTSWVRPTGVLPGRVVSDLAFAGTTLLVVTEMGLYRSNDYGATWQRVASGLPVARINMLFASTPSTVYAGTAKGLYKSINQGLTWAQVTGLANRDIRTLALDPQNARHILAGTTAGLFSSGDGGTTWTADQHGGLIGNASQIGALVFCPAGGDANLYVGTGGGVYAIPSP